MQNYLHLKFPALMTEGLIMHKNFNCEQVGALLIIGDFWESEIRNRREANQIPDNFQPKNKLLYSVYAGDRNYDHEVFITNIIAKTESISDDESTLPSASSEKDSHRVEKGNGFTGQYIRIKRYVKVQSEKYQMLQKW